MNTSATCSPESSPRQRVVVTGIGLVTPFAAAREASWNLIRNGGRAVRWLNADDLGGPLPNGVRFAGAPHARPGRFEPVIELANTAAIEAIRDSRLSKQTLTDIADRCGCVIGTSKVGLRSFAREFRSMTDDRSSATNNWNQLWPDAAVPGGRTATERRALPSPPWPLTPHRFEPAFRSRAAPDP